jgi:two-component sensor histidine kinase
MSVWFRWIAPRHFSYLQQCAVGAGLAGTAVLARLAIHPMLGDTAPYFLLIPTVFVATTVFGGIAGLVLLGSGTVLTLIFVIHENTISLTAGGATIATTIFLVVGIALLVFGIAMRELVLTTRSALVRADALAGEMGHRAKNILALAQVIVRQSAGSSRDVPQLLEIVDARFAALGRAQSVAEIHAGTPPLEELIHDAVSPFEVVRFSVLGERVSVDRETAKNLGLLLHELCTNSMKYGALSLRSGNVAISWALDADFTPAEGVATDIPVVEQNGPH